MATIFATGFQIIAAEAIDYSKKSVVNSSALVENLLGAKSLESAVQIRSEYAQRSYVDFVGYLTKISEIYAKLAKEAFEQH